uniref:Uncharacterized protein n=1 Tax=Oscillatoriales cyanobacterium SpSt-402 TaxID=2282168 RepID=A0A832GZ37_9CYAN
MTKFKLDHEQIARFFKELRKELKKSGFRLILGRFGQVDIYAPSGNKFGVCYLDIENYEYGFLAVYFVKNASTAVEERTLAEVHLKQTCDRFRLKEHLGDRSDSSTPPTSADAH